MTLDTIRATAERALTAAISAADQAADQIIFAQAVGDDAQRKLEALWAVANAAEEALQRLRHPDTGDDDDTAGSAPVHGRGAAQCG